MDAQTYTGSFLVYTVSVALVSEILVPTIIITLVIVQVSFYY